MRDFTRKLMMLDKLYVDAGNVPSAIFGYASRLAQAVELDKPPLRIGLWPIVSNDHPETAMGIAAVFAQLLEYWRDIRVYRLFAHLEGTPDVYIWDRAKSQFSVDDWQVDDLDENVALWGTLEQDTGLWRLRLDLEDDNAPEGSDDAPLEFTAPSIAALINLLPDAAAALAERLGAENPRKTEPRFDPVADPDARVERLIQEWFRWEALLMLALWGKEYTKEALINAHEQLLDAAGEMNGDFGPWCAVYATRRALLAGFGPVRDKMMSQVGAVLARFEDSELPALIIAPTLYQSGDPDYAYEILEKAIETLPDESDLWLTLASLYRQSKRYRKAVEVFQRAIEADAVNALLYSSYGATLIASSYEEGEIIGEFILIDPDDYDREWVSQEAAEAYALALEEEEDSNIRILHDGISLLIARLPEDERLWDWFEQLVEHDVIGEQVRDIVDMLYMLADFEEAIEILESAVEHNPQRYDLRLNLAVVYMTDEAYDAARAQLEEVLALTSDEDVAADVQKLMLSIEDPEFEVRFGEISGIVSAGNTVSNADLDYLEDIIARAPTFSDAYLALARGYLNDADTESALEILLDGYKTVPESPDLVGLLAQLLWDADEEELAFDYLQKGLAAHPNYVPLLAQAGMYLFENDQQEAARGYLARAEAFSPQHPALTRARKRIAALLQQSDGDSED